MFKIHMHNENIGGPTDLHHLRGAKLTEEIWVLHHFPQLRMRIKHTSELWVEIDKLEPRGRKH